MNTLKNTIVKSLINEAYGDNRAKIGAILEVELKYDGNFYWVDEEDYPDMKDWEIRKSNNSNGFVIKIGDPKGLKK